MFLLKYTLHAFYDSDFVKKGFKQAAHFNKNNIYNEDLPILQLSFCNRKKKKERNRKKRFLEKVFFKFLYYLK